MLQTTKPFLGHTVFITGASRGIGKAIALKLAKHGANVIVAAKTATSHPKLPGTIYSVAEQIEAEGGKALPCIVDVRVEQSIQNAIDTAIDRFGGIDILINNASAISLTGTDHTDMNRYDLMHQINARGTFLVSKLCLPFLKRSKHPHILNMSPPLNMNPRWFKDNVAYTIAKYGMSMCTLGMALEFKQYGIGVNSLWPKTAIQTAAIRMLSGYKDTENFTRTVHIMADATYLILRKCPKENSGNFYIDENVLKAEDHFTLDLYRTNPLSNEKLKLSLFTDLQFEDDKYYVSRDKSTMQTKFQ